MKNTAKFISLFLCLAMIFSVGLALIVNAAAVETPSLSVKVVKTESILGEPLYNRVTVEVNLESGSFNALDFSFVKSAAVVNCQTIKAGSGYKAAYELDDSLILVTNPSAASNRSQIAMVAVHGYNKKGQIIVAEFKVFKNSEYTISLRFDSCQITDSNNKNNDVTPTLVSSVKVTTTTTTKKATTTKKSTTTTTKKPTPVNPTPPNNGSGSGSGGSGSGGSGNQGGNSIPVYTGSIPGGAVTPGGVTLPDGSTTDPSETVSEDTSLDYDVYASEYFDSTQESETQQASASLDDVMEDSHSNKKVIIIVAIIAALIIAGAVTAVLLIKKRNKGAANEL